MRPHHVQGEKADDLDGLQAHCKLVSNSSLICFFVCSLQEGKGEAFYEVGVHDNGELIGIEYEEVVYTMVALFHMSQSL